MSNKEKINEFAKKVDILLWKEWDPIGCGVPENEYTSYALVVAGKIWNGVEKKEILDYMYWAESENMGLTRDRGRADQKNSPIVDKLFKLATECK